MPEMLENPVADIAPQKSYAAWRKQQRLAPYLFVSPFVILFTVFGIYPILKSLYLAFHCTNGPRSVVFMGLDNFLFLISDPDFRTALKNTATFAFFSVFLQLPLALGLAMLLNSTWLRGRNVFRFIFFAPNLVGQVFVGFLGLVIFAPRYGLFPRFLNFVAGVDPGIKWLGDESYIMPTLVLLSLWMYVGYNSIYFLAALQSVDNELHEAAAVDGASPWQQFWHVTVPAIKPVILIVVIMSTIGSFQLFELPFTLLEGTGGPNKAGLTLVMYLYQSGFEVGNLGYASTIGWTLTLILMALSLVQRRVSGAVRGNE
ncbi:MAG TPA: sugar ABC transporter permease [Planctomycetota bacterium]|nr:sugar ABC transporter permease [Planctomycetota bacterium]